MQGLLHRLLQWAHWIIIIGIVFVVVTWLTIPVVREMLAAIGGFIIAVFADLGTAIIRKAADIIRSTDTPPTTTIP